MNFSLFFKKIYLKLISLLSIFLLKFKLEFIKIRIRNFFLIEGKIIRFSLKQSIDFLVSSLLGSLNWFLEFIPCLVPWIGSLNWVLG